MLKNSDKGITEVRSFDEPRITEKILKTKEVSYENAFSLSKIV